MGAFGYVACCFALFAFCTADLVPEGRDDVITPLTDYAVRLVGGDDQTQGRFELHINNVWGTVCDAEFSDIDAEVACVSLGFDQNRGNFLRNRFGPGTGDIHFSDVECVGTELAIDDCPHSPIQDVGDCTHDNDVSISCEGVGGYPVRLVGSVEPYQGKLEIQYQGVWGAVCDDYFSDLDAQVACYSLGYGYQGYLVDNTFGFATGVIHLDNVECTGDETNIGYCTHLPWGNHNCQHSEDVALSCTSVADLVPEKRDDVITPFTDYAVRLVGGPDHTQGRLELAFSSDWGTICDVGFSDIDAEVACASLGFDQNRGNFLRNRFGPGTGPIHFSEVECVGTELAIDDCPHSPIQEVGECTHDNDVSISCVGVGGYPVRLVGGFIPYEGRLEIQYQGVWGTVCDDYFSDLSAQVACNSLGLGNQGYVIENNFGDTIAPIHLDDVNCAGDETNIGYCTHAPWGVHNCQSTEYENVAISCSSPADLVPEGRDDVITPLTDYAVRLVGGPDHTQGRFELAISGVWGTVCDVEFSDIDAQVACVSLGFEQNQGNFVRGRFGPGTGEIHFTDVYCVGTELAIDDCPHSLIGDVAGCTHDNDVSITCQGVGYPVRLVGGFLPYEGRLEIQYQGVWGTVCDDYFTDLSAQVACNSLGFGNLGHVMDNVFGETIGPIHLDDVNCVGDETNIGYCDHDPWKVHNCQHYEDIAISCSSPVV